MKDTFGTWKIFDADIPYKGSTFYYWYPSITTRKEYKYYLKEKRYLKSIRFKLLMYLLDKLETLLYNISNYKNKKYG